MTIPRIMMNSRRRCDGISPFGSKARKTTRKSKSNRRRPDEPPERERGAAPAGSPVVIGAAPDRGEPGPRVERDRRLVVLGDLEEGPRGAGTARLRHRPVEEAARDARAPARRDDSQRQDLAFV